MRWPVNRMVAEYGSPSGSLSNQWVTQSASVSTPSCAAPPSVMGWPLTPASVAFEAALLPASCLDRAFRPTLRGATQLSPVSVADPYRG
jgi:hypothetical protein